MMKKYFLTALISFAIPFGASAAELTADALAGKWLFTHMILDGLGERQVNKPMEFTSDGRITSYDVAGAEVSASYIIQDEVIVYSDQRGKQKWQVKEFSEDTLNVDHSGALMFFKRQ